VQPAAKAGDAGAARLRIRTPLLPRTLRSLPALTFAEIIAVMGAAGAGAYGDRLRGVIVVCWRAGLPTDPLLGRPPSRIA
jgi:hypothetical protein